MTFEDKFPSLKDRVYGSEPIFDFVYIKDVEENCLDKSIIEKDWIPKQKVKDSIIKRIHHYKLKDELYFVTELEDMLKELG